MLKTGFTLLTIYMYFLFCGVRRLPVNINKSDGLFSPEVMKLLMIQNDNSVVLDLGLISIDCRSMSFHKTNSQGERSRSDKAKVRENIYPS